MSKEEKVFESGSNGICPHCQKTVTFDSSDAIYLDEKHHWTSTTMMTSSGNDTVYIYSSRCPNGACKKPIVVAKIKTKDEEIIRLVHPFNIVRTVPPEVPKDIGDDFLEASSVLAISEKASAALSRRCLQNLLSQNGFSGKTLSNQIDAALPKLPTDLAENVDAIRNIGNFAAHPTKIQSTGIIVDVESGEASWNLEVLEGLFDFFYVRPAREKARRKRLEKKLADIGKPPLKKP